MKKRDCNKIIAVVTSIMIIGIIFIASPANAFIIGISIPSDEMSKGSEAEVDVSIEINSQEKLNIDYLVLNLIGLEEYECKFMPNGTLISECPGISVTPTGITTGGYGYNYGYCYNSNNCFTDQNLSFIIKLNTTFYTSGEYQTQFIISSKGEETIQDGGNIVIKPIVNELAGCSVRAKGGIMIVGNDSLGDGKLSFHVPLGNADNGKGSLTGQIGRERFSYEFDMDELLVNNNKTAKIKIIGELKINNEKKVPENAIIIFDKLNNKASIENNNIKIENMNVYFRKNC
jgi:hypothetical protein